MQQAQRTSTISTSPKHRQNHLYRLRSSLNKRPALLTAHSRNKYFHPVKNIAKRHFHTVVASPSSIAAVKPSYKTAQLTTIDISPFLDKDGKCITIDESRSIELTPSQLNSINQVTSSLCSQGFFYITNTPLSQHVRPMQSISSKFFAQPRSFKLNSRTYNTRRGYHVFEASPTMGLDIHDEEQSDFVEAFTMQSPYLGDRELTADHLEYEDDDYPDFSSPEEDGEEQHQINNHPNPQPIDPLAHLNLPSGVKLSPEALAQLLATCPPPGHNKNNSPNPNNHKSKTIPHPTPVCPTRRPLSRHKDTQMDTNKWPIMSSEVDFNNSEFKSIYYDYWDAAIETSKAVLTILALAFKFPPSALLSLHRFENHTLESKLYAKPTAHLQLPSADGTILEVTQTGLISEQKAGLENVRVRFPIHSDLSSITLLTQSHSRGGLMIKTRDEGWMLVGEQQHQFRCEGTLIGSNVDADQPIMVNIGNFLSHMTRGKLESSLHCVVNTADIGTFSDDNGEQINAGMALNQHNHNSRIQHDDDDDDDANKPRLSTVFFCMPDYSALIKDLIAEKDGIEPAFQPYQAGDRYPLIG